MVGPLNCIIDYIISESVSVDDIEMVYIIEDTGISNENPDAVNEYIEKYTEKFDWESVASWNLCKDPDAYQPSQDEIQREIEKIKEPRTKAAKQALKEWIEKKKIRILPTKLISCLPVYVDPERRIKRYESIENICLNGELELAKKWTEEVADIYKKPYINKKYKKRKLPDTFSIEVFKDGLIEMFPQYAEEIKDEIEKQVHKPQLSDTEKDYWNATRTIIVMTYVKFARNGYQIAQGKLSDQRENKDKLKRLFTELCPNCEDNIVRWFDQLDYERIRKRVESKMMDKNQEIR